MNTNLGTYYKMEHKELKYSDIGLFSTKVNQWDSFPLKIKETV